MKEDIKAIIETVNKKVIADMEAGNTNWIKSWVEGSHQSIEGHHYSGFNNIWLNCLNFKRHLYGTYIQWNKKGCKIKKGSKAVKLIRVQTGSKTLEDKKTGEEEKKYFKTYRLFPVFNINQVEGDFTQFDKLDQGNNNKVVDVNRIEDFVLKTQAIIKQGQSHAFYNRTNDYIGMPDKNKFLDTKIKSATDNYYAVLLHELTHWTGAPNRLNRTKGSFFGDAQYAFEELIAELGSAYACNYLGLNAQPREDHACYLKGWLKAIKDNSQALIRASGHASKALNYLIECQGIKKAA